MLTGRLQCCLAGKKRNDIVVNIQTFSSCFELWLGGEGKGGSERKRGTNDNRTLCQFHWEKPSMFPRNASWQGVKDI